MYAVINGKKFLLARATFVERYDDTPPVLTEPAKIPGALLLEREVRVHQNVQLLSIESITVHHTLNVERSMFRNCIDCGCLLPEWLGEKCEDCTAEQMELFTKEEMNELGCSGNAKGAEEKKGTEESGPDLQSESTE